MNAILDANKNNIDKFGYITIEDTNNLAAKYWNAMLAKNVFPEIFIEKFNENESVEYKYDGVCIKVDIITDIFTDDVSYKIGDFDGDVKVAMSIYKNYYLYDYIKTFE